MLLSQSSNSNILPEFLETNHKSLQQLSEIKNVGVSHLYFSKGLRKLISFIPFLLLTQFVFAQNQWTWEAGYLVSDAAWSTPRPSPTPLSIRGTPWTLDSTYKPCVREHCGGGIVNNNEIYLYGGASLEDYHASDFWVYDISQQKWAFIEDQGWQPVTDQIGRESTWAHPGGRNRMASAVDKNGSIWFFGGLYLDRNTAVESSLSDLWKYNPKTRRWTFYGADDFSGNKPQSRYRTRAWFDNNNNFWMYAGADDTASGTKSYNDLWMYSTQTNTWTFISGNKNTYFDINTPNGVYPPNPGIGGTQYFPRARSDYGQWKDNLGNIWIYGGYVESHGVDEYGDLWKFNPTTKVWTLIAGTSAFDPQKTASDPGSRNAPYCWVGNDNKLYMMAGSRKYDSFMRDIWRINTVSNVWEPVNNDSILNTVPICAGYRTENSTNTPGTQVCTLTHITTATHTYMLNGYGMGSNTRPSPQTPTAGYTAALWRYSLDGFNAALIPTAKKDTVVSPYKSKIYCKIFENDDLKGSTVNFKTIDLNITMAGKQDSIVTTNGVFSVDTLGIFLFKPNVGFSGTAIANYVFQTSNGYVSNNSQVKITLYACNSTAIQLGSPMNDNSQGNFTYQTNGTIRASDKNVSQQNLPLHTLYNSSKSIELLPGFVSKPGINSTFEAKIIGCN